MGEKSGGERKPEPNLELPSIFGRRKKRRPTEPEASEPSSGLQQPSVTTEEPPSPPAAQLTTEPQGGRSGATSEVRTGPASETDGADGTEPTAVAAPGGAQTERSEAEATRSLPDLPHAAREQETVSAPEIPAPAPRLEADAAPHPAVDTEDVAEPGHSAPTGRAADQRRARRAGGRRAERTSSPVLPGALAAVLTGLVVGLFGAGATYGGTQACDAWRGTSSCGGGPGLLLLIVILALMVLLGALLLTLLAVPEPRSTSFLGVGLTFVVVLVALMSAVFSIWMFFAAPVLSAVAYGVAHWVTTRHVELPESGPEHDVR